MVGLKDEIIANGSMHQSFTPLAWRTYRYVSLDITTKDEQLILEDLYGLYTGYPFTLEAKFESDNDTLNAILETGWRTARSMHTKHIPTARSMSNSSTWATRAYRRLFLYIIQEMTG